MSERSLDDVLSPVPDAKLDLEIDYEHRDERGQLIPRHLGEIARSMTDWEGVIADHLGLSEPVRREIRCKYPNRLELQK